MYTNALYVFDIKFGSDVVNLMKEFTPHPITESREMGDNVLLSELCNMYDNFCVYTQKKVKKLKPEKSRKPQTQPDQRSWSPGASQA